MDANVLSPNSFLNELSNVEKRASFLKSTHPRPDESVDRISVNDTTHWISHPLRIIYLVSRFLHKLRSVSDQQKFKYMTQRIFDLIRDKASNYQFYESLGFIRTKQLQSILSIQIPIVQPDNHYKVAFDGLILVLITLNLFYIPLKLAFTLEGLIITNEMIFLLDYLPSIVFIIEMILKFNTAYYKDGIAQEDRSQIVLHYLHNGFISDFIMVIPFILNGINIPYMKFILLLRVFRLRKMIENFEETTSIREYIGVALDLSKLIFMVIFFIHLVACLWNYTGEAFDINTSWISAQNLTNVSWGSRYINCFYWSTLTSLTVGYGDIVPTNDFEKGIVATIVICSSIVFGYTISSIGAIFQSIDERNLKYKNSLAQISTYIKQRKLNPKLQTKVKKYFEYTLTQQLLKTSESEILMDSLTPELKQEVKIDMYMKMIKKCIAFRDFADETLNKICQKVVVHKMNPNQIIINDSKLVFILSGKIKVILNGEYLRDYKKGFVIGLREFITQQQSAYQCISVDFVDYAAIDYRDLLSCLTQMDNERLLMMRDNILFNPYYKVVRDVCQICSSSHMMLDCPYPFFQLNKNKALSQTQTDQPRDTLTRRPTRALSFRTNRKDYQMCALALCVELGQLKEDEVDNHLEPDKNLNQGYTPSLSVMHSQQAILQFSDRQKLEFQATLRKSMKNDLKKSEKEMMVKLQSLSEHQIQMLEVVKIQYQSQLKGETIDIDSGQNFSVFFSSWNQDTVLEKLQPTKKRAFNFLRKKGSFRRQFAKQKSSNFNISVSENQQVHPQPSDDEDCNSEDQYKGDTMGNLPTTKEVHLKYAMGMQMTPKFTKDKRKYDHLLKTELIVEKKRIAYQVYFLTCSCILLWLAIQAYENGATHQDQFNQILSNWQNGVIVDITYTNTSSSCSSIGTDYKEFIVYQFPGTVDACDCTKGTLNISDTTFYSNKMKVGFQCKISSKCSTVLTQEPRYMTMWSDGNFGTPYTLCAKRLSDVNLVNRGCDKYPVVCGTTDYKFCVPLGTQCPITRIGFQKDQYFKAIQNGTINGTIYSAINFYFTREQKMPLSEVRISEGFLNQSVCSLNNSLSNLSYGRKEYPLMVVRRSTCTEQDPLFTRVATITENQYFLANSLLFLEDQLPYFKLSTTYLWSIFTRDYIDWTCGFPDIIDAGSTMTTIISALALQMVITVIYFAFHLISSLIGIASAFNHNITFMKKVQQHQYFEILLAEIYIKIPFQLLEAIIIIISFAVIQRKKLILKEGVHCTTEMSDFFNVVKKDMNNYIWSYSLGVLLVILVILAFDMAVIYYEYKHGKVEPFQNFVKRISTCCNAVRASAKVNPFRR